jgi:hypothetical protein
MLAVVFTVVVRPTRPHFLYSVLVRRRLFDWNSDLPCFLSSWCGFVYFRTWVNFCLFFLFVAILCVTWFAWQLRFPLGGRTTCQRPYRRKKRPVWGLETDGTKSNCAPEEVWRSRATVARCWLLETCGHFCQQPILKGCKSKWRRFRIIVCIHFLLLYSHSNLWKAILNYSVYCSHSQCMRCAGQCDM